MLSTNFSLCRLGAVVLIVLALLVVVVPVHAEAAAMDSCARVSAATAVPVTASLSDIMANRSRLIQVACVVAAVGVFLLTRSYR